MIYNLKSPYFFFFNKEGLVDFQSHSTVKEKYLLLYSCNQKIEPHRAKSNIIPNIKTSLLIKLKGKKTAESFRNIAEFDHLCQSNHDL